MPIDNAIVSVAITVKSSAPSRAGFGTPLIAAYHTAWPNRVRSYTDPGDLLDDGFTVNSPVYKAMSKMWAQSPHPPSCKVGRRANAFTQDFEFYPINVTKDFVYEFTITEPNGDEVEIAVTVGVMAGIDDVCDALVVAFTPAAADVEAANAETYVMVDGMTLVVDVDGTRSVALFETADFVDPAVATSAEIQTVLDADIAGQTASGTTKPKMTSDTTGVRSTVKVIGGSANAILGFPTSLVRGTGVTDMTPTDNDTYVTLTADNDGELFDIDFGSLNPVNDLRFQDVTSDPGITADLAAIYIADQEGWYGLVLDSNSKAEVTAAALWVEGKRLIASFNSSDGDIPNTIYSDDLFSDMKGLSYVRHHLQFSKSQLLSYSGAAILARMLPTDPGTATWAYKTLAGVATDDLLASEKTQITDKGGNWYASVGSIGITFEGLSPGGEYLDTTRFVDMLYARLKENVFTNLINNDKIPGTDVGIGIIGSTVQGTLMRYVSTPNIPRGLASDPAPETIVPKAASRSTADKAGRILRDVRFTATLAGAIHHIIIQGTLSV